MKKTQLTTAFILSFLLISAITVAQSTEIRNLSGFTKVGFGVPGNLNIRIGSEFKVVLEGDKEWIDRVVTEVSNGKLTIKRKEEASGWFRRGGNWTGKVTVNITMPALSELTVSGSGKAEVFDSFRATSLNLSVSGSGKLILNDVSGEALTCGISGSGGLIIKGNGSFDKANIRVSGSGGYSGESLKLQDAEVTISGSGNSNCYVTNSLDVRVSGSGNCNSYVGNVLNASISGSGNVTYSGSPKIDARISGSGKVRAR